MTVTALNSQVRTVQNALDEARMRAESAHPAAVDALPEPMRHIVCHRIGWWDADGSPAANPSGPLWSWWPQLLTEKLATFDNHQTEKDASSRFAQQSVL